MDRQVLIHLISLVSPRRSLPPSLSTLEFSSFILFVHFLGGVVLVQDENEGGFVAQPYNAAEANRLKALEEEEQPK